MIGLIVAFAGGGGFVLLLLGHLDSKNLTPNGEGVASQSDWHNVVVPTNHRCTAALAQLPARPKKPPERHDHRRVSYALTNDLELTTLDIKDAYLNVDQPTKVVIRVQASILEEGAPGEMTLVLDKLLPGHWGQRLV